MSTFILELGALMPVPTLAAPRAALLVSSVAIAASLSPLAAPAQAAPTESWDAPRQVAGGSAQMGGDGEMLAIAEWVDTSPDLDHPQQSLRVRLSTDGGDTFRALPDAPSPVQGSRVGSVVVDAAQSVVIVASIDGRFDRYTPGDGWTTPSAPAAACNVPSAPVVTARRAATILVVDACLQTLRSVDAGQSFERGSAVPLGESPSRPFNNVVNPHLAMTSTANGFLVSFIGRTSGGFDRVYASASTDDGMTFSPGQLISAVAQESARSLSTAYDSRTGVVAVAAEIVEQTGESNAPVRLQVHRSTDAGLTFSSPVQLHRSPSRGGGVGPGYPLLAATVAGLDVTTVTFPSGGAVMIRRQSRDGGLTWAAARPPALVGGVSSAVGSRQVHLLRNGVYQKTNDNPAPTTMRLAGTDRLGTAIAISKDAWANQQAQSVVLARHDAFPDALAGTPLAVAKNGPLLLTPSTGLNANIGNEIKRVLPAGRTVYLLGGTAALSQGVADAVTRLGYKVARLGGNDRYATAVTISKQLGTPSRIFEATGLSFQNALISGVAAAGSRGVVILTADGKMPPATKAYLDSFPNVERVAVGAAAATADPNATKVAGSNVYDTARLVAEKYFPSPGAVAVASGTVFADALAGGAHIGRLGGPLLLSEPSNLPPPIASYLSSNKYSLTAATLYGGPAALSTGVEDAVRSNVR